MNEHAETATGIGQWRDTVRDNPDVTWRILSDIVKIVQADKTPKRTGRRPAPDMVGVDELLDIIYPERFSMEPFTDALDKLMGDTTQVVFAKAMNVSQPHLSRLLKGKVEPDMALMAAAAEAGGVTPAYFREWRAAWLAEAITDLFINHPNRSVIAVKQIARTVKF